MEKKIVKNNSKAYGYNYASLSDIAEQGFEIPEMRTKPMFTPDGATFIGDYIEYKDKDGNWQLGARIINPAELDMKGSNLCQKLGSSITYSRRYSTLMCHGLSCDDDKKLEKAAPAPAKPAQRTDFAEVRAKLKQCTSDEQVEMVWNAIPEKLRQYFEKDYQAAKEAF